jgi:hypothetical protein
MHFVYLGESRAMKSVEIVLRSGGERMKDSDGGVNPMNIHCKYVWKWHNHTSPNS